MERKKFMPFFMRRGLRGPHSTFRAAFTIIELLVVVAIIAVLAAIVLANVTSPKNAARNAKRAEELRSMQEALTLYHSSHGAYPGTPGTTIIITGGSVDLSDLVTEGYISAIPTDPLGTATPYLYCPSGNGATAQDYVLRATMELEDNAVPPRYGGGLSTGPYPSCDCNYASNRHYCVGSF